MSFIAAITWRILTLISTVHSTTTIDSIYADYYDDTAGRDKPYNITIGVQTALVDWEIQHEGTFFLNLNRINNQSSLLPNHRLRPYLKDDGGDAQRAFFVALELNGVDWSLSAEEVNEVDFIFGGSYSSTSMSTGSVTQSFQTPQMSCAATNADLSDKEKYGTFARTISSDATQSCAWAAIASFFNWTTVGVISSKSDYGLGLSQGFAECAGDFGIEIKVEINFDTGVTDHSAKLQNIRDRETFIWFIAMHNQDAQNLSVSLNNDGLTGWPYVYIGSDALGEKVEGIIENLPGVMYTTPYQAWMIEDTNEVASLVEWFNASVYEVADKYGEEPSTTGLGIFAPYCWDVALVLAEYFHFFTETYSNTSTMRTGGNWSHWLQTYSGVGATGNLSFDENLDPSLNRWTVYNCWNNECNVIGVATSTGAELYDDSEVYWPNGDTGIANTPLDHTTTVITWIYISDSAWHFYVCFCALTLTVTIVIVVLSYFSRDHELVRMSAYKINMITLLGMDIFLISFAFQLLDEKHYNQSELGSICFAKISLFFIGFPLFVGTIFFKIYRVHKIFNCRRLSLMKKKISDEWLLKVVLLYMILNFIFIFVYQQIHPWRRVIIEDSVTQIDIMTYEKTVYGKCQIDNELPFLLVLGISNGYVIIQGAKWAWDTRKIAMSALNDSVQVGYILMLIILLGGFNIILSTMESNPNREFFVLFTSFLIVAWFSIGVLFLLKFWTIIRGNVGEDDFDPTSTYGGHRSSSKRAKTCPHCHKLIMRSGESGESSYNTIYSETVHTGLHAKESGSGKTSVEMLAGSETRPRPKTLEEKTVDELLAEADISIEDEPIAETKIYKDFEKAVSQEDTGLCIVRKVSVRKKKREGDQNI